MLSASDIMEMRVGRVYPIKDDADNSDLRKSIIAAVPKAAEQTRGYAKKFKGKTNKDTARKIFDFLLSRTYVPDTEEQLIRLPSALTRGGAADCKSFALFTAAILENLGINYNFVFTSYNDSPVPTHVYIQLKDGTLIDAVWGKFDSEKKPTYKYLKAMNAKYITGLGNCGSESAPDNYAGLGCDCSNDGIDGLGDKLKQFGSWVKEKAQDVKQVAKKTFDKAKEVALAPGRGVFRIMVETNLDGFATKLSKMNQATLLNYWDKVGGSKSKLAASIKKGAGRPQKKFGLLAKMKATLAKKGHAGIMGGGEYLEETIAVVAPAAGAAVGSIVPGAGTAVGAGAGASFGAVLIAILPVVQQLLAMTGDEKAPEGDTFFDPGPLPPVDPDDIKDDTNAPKPSGSGSGFLAQKNFTGLSNGTTLLIGAGLGIGVYVAKKKGWI